MATYKTPGVYVEEITTLPPSVAEVETAIPAFMGFTQFGGKNVAKRITSFKEYQEYYGSADFETNISATVERTNGPDGKPEDKAVAVAIDPLKKTNNVMYYALQLYFANGGGPCYIISAGNFADSNNDPRKALGEALRISSQEDEPTLLVFPDAPFNLRDPAGYYSLMNDALNECKRLGDRFAIIDVLDVSGDRESSIESFRNGITVPDLNLKYGAAYYPYLNTTVNYVYRTQDINVFFAGDHAIAKRITDTAEAFQNAKTDADTAKTQAGKLREDANKLKELADAQGADKATKDAAKDADTKAKDAEKASAALDTELTKLQQAAAAAVAAMPKQTYEAQTNLVQNQIKKMVDALGVQLSPCAAVAGVYANIDSTRGVWKAPANISLNYVTSATVKITDEDQKDLNVDVNAGKSVNAIRSFIGMGTKIWGARTLAGNDNEWRYINVRRFFNMVEESIKKSTFWAVFEPNDINTWTRVRAMIENYLLLKWKDGALAGTKPDDAFFVRVGLGQTMSPLDVLEGRMIIEIGLAAVRPAEFIILKFSHKLQTS